jgi:hypothetical protein
VVALNGNSPYKIHENMDIYRFCEHCNRRVSEKTFKEHRRLYFHEKSGYLPVKATERLASHGTEPDREVELVTGHDSSALSISLPESNPL